MYVHLPPDSGFWNRLPIGAWCDETKRFVIYESNVWKDREKGGAKNPAMNGSAGRALAWPNDGLPWMGWGAMVLDGWNTPQVGSTKSVTSPLVLHRTYLNNTFPAWELESSDYVLASTTPHRIPYRINGTQVSIHS